MHITIFTHRQQEPSGFRPLNPKSWYACKFVVACCRYIKTPNTMATHQTWHTHLYGGDAWCAPNIIHWLWIDQQETCQSRITPSILAHIVRKKSWKTSWVDTAWAMRRSRYRHALYHTDECGALANTCWESISDRPDQSPNTRHSTSNCGDQIREYRTVVISWQSLVPNKLIDQMNISPLTVPCWIEIHATKLESYSSVSITIY